MPLFHHHAQADDTAPLPVTPFRAGGQPAGGIAPRAATALPKFSGNYVLLADCSEFQPSLADATYLRWSRAIVIRACYGDAHDDKAWYGGQRRADLHKGGALFLGLYQYLVAGQDGAAQANALHALVGGLQRGEVLIADFEEGAKGTLTAWYNRMQALGYPDKYLWTYTGEYFGRSQGVLPVQWLADYTSVEPAGAHTLWQFTDRYPVPGVGTTDASVYHGTVEQLASLAYQGAPAPKPAPAPGLAPAPGGLRETVTSSGAAVTFTWGTVPGHTSYHFQLEWWKPGFGWDLSQDTQVTGTTERLALAPRTRYRWRVAAGTSQYTWAAWTEFATP